MTELNADAELAEGGRRVTKGGVVIDVYCGIVPRRPIFCNSLSFGDAIAPLQCTSPEFERISALFRDQIRSKLAKRTLCTVDELRMLNRGERVDELRNSSIRFVRALERYARKTICKLPRKLAVELDAEWCESFVRITRHLYNRELHSPCEAVLAAYVFVYVCRVWQRYVGSDPQTGLRSYVPHDCFLDCFTDEAANLTAVCKATGLPAIRLHDLCTFVSQFDEYVKRGRSHYRNVDPEFWSVADDARAENEREIYRVCMRIRHSSKWPRTLAENVSDAAATQNFYFLVKNLFCACSFTMCMFRTSAIDALRAIQTRADELYVQLYKLSGQMMSEKEIVACMYVFANAEHPSNRVKCTAPQEICMTTRIFRD
jgi:hypothetical protein